MSDDLFVRCNGELAFLILNRPTKRNAITEAMWRRLPDLLAAVATDRAVKVLVVRGADATAFAAGADIDEFERLHASPAAARAFQEIYARGIDSLASFPKPAIAVIQGPCVGAGFTIAAACDLRIADRSAVFAITAARLGHVYRLEDTKRLIALVGNAPAKELLFTGRVVGADEAKELGLVERLCDTSDLEAAVLKTVNGIAETSQFSVRATKRIVAMIAAGDATATEASSALFLEAIRGEDYQEGLRAFREKRNPKFTFA
jgi:enoyl-CoA hydratase/carnithine racemase